MCKDKSWSYLINVQILIVNTLEVELFLLTSRPFSAVMLPSKDASDEGHPPLF